MSKQEDNEKIPEDTIVYVYVPDENIYGIIKREGIWSSIIQYYEDGIEYNIEMSNDEFIILNEIGVGYIDETEENL